MNDERFQANPILNLKGQHGQKGAAFRTPGSATRLDNVRAVSYRYILEEKPWHRQAMELAKQGFNHKEIGEVLGKSPNGVSNVLQQDRSQKYIVDTIKQTAHQTLAAAIEKAASGALDRILACAEDEVLKVKDPKTYIQANQEILNRFLGKPSQPLEHKHVNPDTLPDEELANLAGRARSPLLD